MDKKSKTNLTELEKHIGNQITDVAQSLEELEVEYGTMKFNGVRVVDDIDGSGIPIDEMIERVSKFAQMAREMEHNFKYV